MNQNDKIKKVDSVLDLLLKVTVVSLILVRLKLPFFEAFHNVRVILIFALASLLPLPCFWLFYMRKTKKDLVFCILFLLSLLITVVYSIKVPSAFFSLFV